MRDYNGGMNASSRSGAVAVIGRPNVGKSTLVNALVGAKISITSNRPQTTRHRLLGIASFPGGQLQLVDTPGIHGEQGKRSGKAMNRMMNRAARGALEGVDAAVLVVEAGRWDNEDGLAFDALRDAGLPVVLVVNQVDKIKDKGALLPFIAKVTEGREFAAVHPLSALERSGLEPLVQNLLGLMPIAPPMYGEDEITDKSQRFLAGELVREQLMRQLGEELPYATTVEIEKFEEEPSPRAGVMYRIDAVVWVEREGQKAIVIGKGGERLREIGSRARQQMEHSVIEYGNAIKDLVAANIFPGDMLWKNFGVTRNGKVVFYDYDEIEYLTDCNFRRVPTPATRKKR